MSLAGATSKLKVSDDTPTEGLLADLEKAKKEVEEALLNSFDTPQVMRIIAEIIRITNIHVNERKSDADLAGVEAVARWVTKMVGILGLDANASPPYDGLGWASASTVASGSPEEIVKPYAAVYESAVAATRELGLETTGSLHDLLNAPVHSDFQSVVATGTRDPETLALPYIRAVSRLRDELRRIATTPAAASKKKEILALCDRIRDQDLSDLGVYLDDRPDGQPSLVKFVPAAQLRAQREEKAAREREKQRAKDEQRLAREAAEKEKWARASVPPEDMFKGDERFSEWDPETGLPTKMKDGSEVNKSQAKKLAKEREKQKKAHEEWKAKFGGAATLS